jgi:intein/homing endonuclease
MITKRDKLMLEDLNWDMLSKREQGYLLGIFLGDGNVFVNEKKGIYRVRFCLTKGEATIQKIIPLLQKLFRFHKIRVYNDRKNETLIEVHSKSFVQKLYEILNNNTLKTMEQDSETLCGLIEGLIDSDGYVKGRIAEIKSSNKQLVSQICSLLEKIGIKYKLTPTTSQLSNKIVWRFYFHLPYFISPVKASSGRRSG